jgi:plasmid stability protein
LAALTIRNVDSDLKLELRKKAAANNRSMEEEARVALRDWVRLAPPKAAPGLGTLIRQEVERLGGGVEFDLPEDELYEAPVFDRE